MVENLFLRVQHERTALRERATELQNENNLLRNTIMRAHQLVAEHRLDDAAAVLTWTLERIADNDSC